MGNESDKIKVRGLPVDYEETKVSPRNLVSKITLSIFFAEILIMVVLNNFISLSPFAEAVVDAAMVVMLVCPMLYFSLFRPLVESVDNYKRIKETLEGTLKEMQQRDRERQALLKGAQAVLKYHNFNDAAHSIFDICKELIGATAGYIAVLSADKEENELVFLDSGKIDCDVDPALPMPIRGLRTEAYHSRKTVYENDFSNSRWQQYLPQGHAQLDNVMFAPLLVEGNSIGVLGLANKAGGFNDNDARFADAFANIAAVTFQNSRSLELLEDSELRFRSLAQTATDAVISINQRGDVVFWNESAERIFGYSADEIWGEPVTTIIPERFKNAHVTALKRTVNNRVSHLAGKTVELVGEKKDSSEFPLELSLAKWESKEDLFFTGIIRDITKRKDNEQKLKQTLEELSRSNSELQQFANVISHDLQAPLRTVKNYSELLSRKYKGRIDKKGGKYLEYIDNGTDRMQKLIADLLSYSRVGRLGVYLEQTNVDDILRQVLDSLAVAIEESGALVTYDPLPEVTANPTQINQLLQNLVGNAIKFHGEKVPKVHITAAEGKEEWIFSVSDNGIGIEPEYFDRIFAIFQRLHTADEYPGTGVGLAICKRIMECHAGRIWLESELGKGTTFYFSIPA